MFNSDNLNWSKASAPSNRVKYTSHEILIYFGLLDKIFKDKQYTTINDIIFMKNIVVSVGNT